MKNLLKQIIHELKEHIPFTSTAAFVSIVLTLIVLELNLIKSTTSIFYIFHPIHVFFSAIVSAALLYKYKKNIILSLFAGIFISVAIGSISDAIFPFLGSSLIGIPISFHLPAIENPLIILGAGLLGSITGIISKKTKFPHFIHVFVSAFASLLYIFAYSSDFTITRLFSILIITIIAVIVPCCLGDIVFPLLLNKSSKEKSEVSSHGHTH